MQMPHGPCTTSEAGVAARRFVTFTWRNPFATGAASPSWPLRWRCNHFCSVHRFIFNSAATVMGLAPLAIRRVA
jgi:hypothetical protein